jgi:hypothetical protein
VTIPRLLKSVPADRTTDAAVALLLGWEQCPCSNPNCSFWMTPDKAEYDAELPRFSSDDTAALSLVSVMATCGYSVFILWCDGAKWCAGFYHTWDETEDTEHDASQYGDTPAAAIAQAFLAVRGT